MKNVNDVIDEYCIKKYGHRDWDYLRTDDVKKNNRMKKYLKEIEHTVEGGIVIFHALDDLIKLIKEGRFGLKH